jgi:hypothetical protein
MSFFIGASPVELRPRRDSTGFDKKGDTIILKIRGANILFLCFIFRRGRKKFLISTAFR